MAFNGTDDTFVPFNGNPDPVYGTLPVQSSIALWVGIDRCGNEPEVSAIPQSIPDDGTTVTRYTYANGIGGSVVVSYVIEHFSGHTWPGKRSANPSDPKGVAQQRSTQRARF